MTVWMVGQQVALNRERIITIDRITPSGFACSGESVFNLEGNQGWGNLNPPWQILSNKIETLTPELLKRINLVKRYTKARTIMHHAARNLNAWATEHCSFYSERVPDLAEIEQIERVAAATVAALPVEKKVAP